MPDINVNKLSEALNNKADIDLNNTGVFSTNGGVVNLTSSTPADASGKEVTSADFFQSNLLNYTTNRILEIPQDIKLELNNGKLTLKAGSKVYVPNGFEADGTTPKFNEVVISSDLTNTTTANTQLALTVYSNNLAPFLLSSCFSGGSAPTSSINGTLWYDTTNNKIKVYANSIWRERNDCLPIALLTANGTSYTSIDQVFNGFGYIGSTMFVLPGVKVQIPDGRNEDETCRSFITTVDSVKTITRPDSLTANMHWYLLNDLSAYSSNIWSFDADKNIYVSSQLGDRDMIEIARGYLTSGKITSFEPFTVDSVVNSNEFYQLKDKTVTTDTAQTIRGVKTFNSGTLQALKPILLKEDNADEGGQIYFQRSNNSVLKSEPYIDLLVNTIRFIGINSNNTVNVTLQVDLENKRVSVPTPATTANDNQAATTAWVNAKVGGFANTNASNFTSAGKQTIVGWGMPDYSAGIAISEYTTASKQFTAPKDGILSIVVNSNNDGNVYIDGTARACVNNNDQYARAYITLPISKGEKFYAPSVINMTNFTSCFYPLKGVN